MEFTMPSGVYKRTKPAWNKGLTKDTDERVRKNVEASRNTVQQKYGVSSVFQIPEVQAEKEANKEQVYKKVADTKLQRYGDSHYNNMEKNRQTKLNNHGDANYNNPEKYKETSLLKYGYEHPNQNPEQKEKIRHSRQVNNSNEKAKQTIIAKYGSLDKYYSEMNMKRFETMKENGTLGNKETIPEKELYQQLCDQYGEDHVHKQYVDKERYPFRCDFYIDSEDKFIELNGFWTHGTHPFDKDNEDDLKFAAELETRNSEWSKAFLYTWTDLDVRKLETAKKNNLNYEMIYWYNR